MRGFVGGVGEEVLVRGFVGGVGEEVLVRGVGERCR